MLGSDQSLSLSPDVYRARAGLVLEVPGCCHYTAPQALSVSLLLEPGVVIPVGTQAWEDPACIP